MRKYQQDGTLVIMGEDLPDTVGWLRATPPIWRNVDSRTHPATRDWDDGLGWDGALRMAEHGWTDGALDLERRLSRMPPHVNTHANLRYDVAGERPDIGRFISGDPAHMVKQGSRHGNPPIVTIVVNTICSGSTSAKAFMEYGTALTAMVDQLESRGKRVELYVATVNTFNGKGRGIFGWCVKQAGEHVDLAAVAFSVAHPAAYRRFGFALWERTPWQCYGHGTCATFKKGDDVTLNLEGALLIEGIGTRFHSGERDMLKLVAEQINAAAGETLVEVE